MANNIFKFFYITYDKVSQVVFHHVYVLLDILQKYIVLSIYPVPLAGVFFMSIRNDLQRVISCNNQRDNSNSLGMCVCVFLVYKIAGIPLFSDWVPYHCEWGGVFCMVIF